MPEDNDLRRVFARRDTTGENSFDELAKGLAVGTITRGQVLKMAGSAILSAMLNSLFFPSQALAQKECDPDEVLCGSKCCDPEDCCGSTCCGPARKCCSSTCCGPTQECCYGTCCEHGKVCDATSGLCVCSPQRITCGSDCCDPVLETCGQDGLCHNPFCESCQAEGGQCSQSVEGGVLISEACCYSGERICTRSGAGSICCPAGTRCPDEDLGEAFACVSL
jgi:hypothetical protein